MCGDQGSSGQEALHDLECGGIPQVVGSRLEGEAPDGHRPTGQVTADGPTDLVHYPVELLAVHLDGAVQELEVVPGLSRLVDECPGVLREAAPSPTRARPEVAGADALVVAEGQHDVVDVGADALADGGYGVGERELGHQEGVGGVLDGLGRRRVGEDHRGIDPVVEGPHDLGGAILVAADDDPVGSQEVGHSGALTQELRVRRHGHVVAIDDPGNDGGGPDRHRGLVHDDRPCGQRRTDGCGGGLHVREVHGTVRGVRGGQAQEHHLAVDDRTGHVGREPQAVGGQPLEHELGQAGLHYRHLARLQAFDLVDVHVGAEHVVAQVGQAGAGGQADVAGTDYRQSGHGGESRMVGPNPRRPTGSPIGRPSGRSRLSLRAVRSPSACRGRPTR